MKVDEVQMCALSIMLRGCKEYTREFAEANKIDLEDYFEALIMEQAELFNLHPMEVANCYFALVLQLEQERGQR
jgi:hypothetical protein